MFQQNIPLKPHSNYKIGGAAAYFFEAKRIDEITRALAQWRKVAPSQIRKANLVGKIFILGGGSNVLINDEGFNGLVLKPSLQFIKKEGESIKVGAGIKITDLLNYLIDKKLSGLEWAAGLPGTIGGAIFGNAGSFGSEMESIVKEVISLDISTLPPKIIKRNNKDCNFGYRASIFKQQFFDSSINSGSPRARLRGDKFRTREIIIEAIFNFKKGDKKKIDEIVKSNTNYRREHQPVDYPSLGSIFKNIPVSQIDADIKRIDADNIRVYPRGNSRLRRPAFRRRLQQGEGFGGQARKSAIIPIKTDPFPVIPVAHLISEAGLKGISFGGAMISPKHPNFIVNVFNASAQDVKNLIDLVIRGVGRKF